MALAKASLRRFLFLFFILLICNPSALPRSAFAAQEDSDEAEIIYTEAKIAVNGGDYRHGLELAKKAMQLDPYHLPNLELAYQCAEKLKLPSELEALAPGLKAAKEKDRILRSATQHMELAIHDLEENRTNDSIARYSFIENLSVNKQSDVRELVEEARFRRGLVHLEQQDVREAFSALLHAGPGFRQRAAYVIGNYLFQQGYLAQSYAAFQRATDPAIGERDQEVARASLEAMKKIDRFGLELRATLVTTSDSNPFGLPSYLYSYQGANNALQSASAGLSGSVSTPVNQSNHILFRGLFGINEGYTLERDYRQTLDAQTFNLGASAYMSSFGSGRATFRYLFQYSQSPTQVAADTYQIQAASRSHALNIDLTREMSRRLDLRFGYRGTLARFLTPLDSGPNDRSNLSHGLWVGATVRTKSRIFKPTFTIGGDYINSWGELNSNRLAYATLYNYMPLGPRWESEISLSLEHSDYFNFLSERLDWTYRGSLSLNYWLTPKVAFVGQCSYAQIRSTFDYYTQNRIVISLGINASLL